MRLVAILAVLLMLTGCSGSVPFLAAAPTPTPTCFEQAKQFADQLKSVAAEWDDANKLAGQTPRMSLPPQIANLQAIRRRAQDQPALSCLVDPQRYLVQSMDETIEGYLAFLGQEEAKATNRLRNADTSMRKFSTSLSNFYKELLGVTATPSQ